MADKRKPTAKEVEYQALVNERMPKSRVFSQCVRAFAVGGLICCIGQLLRDWALLSMGLDEDATAAFTAIVLVFIGATLTGVGLYDRIGAWAGAGSVVPITGFANSIVSPAMEFRREGLVLGLGAKLFAIAGPVLVYGISASVIVGLLSLVFG